MSVDFDIMANAFYAICIIFLVSVLSDVLLQSFNGNFHHRV